MIKCVAIDDEPMALLIIEQFCQRKGNIVLNTFSEPSAGLKAIEEKIPDLVFLDIQMNSVSGLEIANRIPKGCCIIFTTAHAKYALEGFNLDAVDFLHKPFSYERFGQAVDKAYRRMETQQIAVPQVLSVIQEYCNISIPLEDITYIEALGNYVKIFRQSGGHVLSRTNMKAIATQLPERGFIRVHRSFIVAVRKIQKFTRTSILVEGRMVGIPIGKKYAEQVALLLRNTY